MRLVVAVVGKPRDRHLAAAIDEYETRAARYWPLAVAEVREASGRGVSAPDARRKEGERLLERLPAGALVIVCDETGDRLTSAEFAAMLAGARDAARDVAFVVGGAYGLDDVVRRAAARSLQLAPWTLPHELARLVLAEQLYRAGTIVRGEPYHK
ncbi:MAG TPA: 23S rRNA (pseudouridine(1915)-N(3))-methyltransferase RlmH [Gemmatimonadaceae bacterium]|nr:23S rRNA (pseudouridine(1915)-N(3))-methyltransferase RlmH [Gemmatimonadaceae bacterium]